MKTDRRSLRRTINISLNVLLPWLLIVSFATGWIASGFGMTEFGMHKWSSVAVFVVALAHLGLHWRSLVGQLKHVAQRDRQPVVPPRTRPVLRLVEADSSAAMAGEGLTLPTAVGE